MPLTLGVKTIECKIMQIWNCWAAPSWWSGKSPKLRRNVTNNYLADREFNVARKECKQNVFFQPFFVTRLILGKSDVFLCKVKYPTIGILACWLKHFIGNNNFVSSFSRYLLVTNSCNTKVFEEFTLRSDEALTGDQWITTRLDSLAPVYLITGYTFRSGYVYGLG